MVIVGEIKGIEQLFFMGIGTLCFVTTPFILCFIYPCIVPKSNSSPEEENETCEA